jgi:hypothetical protein
MVKKIKVVDSETKKQIVFSVAIGMEGGKWVARLTKDGVRVPGAASRSYDFKVDAEKDANRFLTGLDAQFNMMS